jgi:membrane dipeptidase
MAWRDRPSLSPDEARQLHAQALVIDSQQPPVTSGFLFTEHMREQLEAWREEGLSRADVAQAVQVLTTREIQTSAEARRTYRDFWHRSGVTVACGTYSGSHRMSQAFEASVRAIAQAHAFIGALDGDLVPVLKAADIERVHATGKHGLILDFQNTTAFGDDPGRVAVFYNLGIRMVQLTYNLQNLVGDGCTETYQGGLTYFGREIVGALNEFNILVDVSHCSEQVGWDALKTSTSPIVVSHSASKTVAHHDRGKTDALAKAIADRGGYFGVAVIPGFISNQPKVTLDVFCRHVEHLARTIGIDHVGIGTDKVGPPTSRTGSMIEFPRAMPARRGPASFDWVGFRLEEHRLTNDYAIEGYETFADWPNVTQALARWGFNEEELRKLLGLNFLRVFREVVG